MFNKLVPKTISEVPTPCLLLDKDILKRNAQKMLDTAKNLGIQLRAHMKTQKTLEIGEMMTGGTKSRICVSTLDEAKFFSDGGFTDILYAVPISENKMKMCQELVKDVPELKLMFSSRYGAQCISDHPRPDGKKWSAVLKIDCGYGRTGLEWDGEEVLLTAQEADKSPNIDFMGVYTHCGDTHDAEDVDNIHRINDLTSDRLNMVAKRLKDNGVNCPVIGTGSTPGCNQPTQKMSNLTEIHPGGYIFNDYSMSQNGGNSLSDVAIRVATRIIDHKISKKYLIIDCGVLALNLDGTQDGNGYEDMCLFQDHPELKLKGMTQELSKVTVKGDMDFSKYPIGSMLFIYPYHACYTAAMHPVYYIHSGDVITDTWKPTRGWYA